MEKHVTILTEPCNGVMYTNTDSSQRKYHYSLSFMSIQ